MAWKFWCFSILNLFIIVTEANTLNSPSLIVENKIPNPINPDILRITIKQEDGTVLYELVFKKTKGILANSRTPVIDYVDNIENSQTLINFYPDYQVMQGIGIFSFYHDIDNKASAVLFSDSNGLYLDGIIADEFKLNKFPVNYLNNVLQGPTRDIIIKESSSNIESLKKNDWSELNNAVQKINVFYPELLVVLDYNLIANVSKIQAIKTQLVYWNAVDMLFASMKSPEIYLNIAAFILPSSKSALQFMNNDPQNKFVDFYDAIEGIETLFYKYRNQISIDYDIIVIMTGAKLCMKPTIANPVMNCINGYSEGRPDTLNKFDDKRKVVDSSAILHFDNQVSSYTNAAQKIGYMFTGEFTKKKEIDKCPGIMEEYYRRGKFSLSWSNCTQRKVTRYLQSPKAEGLKNFPKYILEEKKSQLLPTEPPKSSKWWNNLSKWLFNKNKDKNDKISDVIITTEAYLSEKVPKINKPNVDLQQEFTTSKTFLPEINEKISENRIPNPSESFLDENRKNALPDFKSRIGDKEINTSKLGNDYSEFRNKDLPSTTTKVLTNKSRKRDDRYIFVDVTDANEQSVVEKQIDRQSRQYPLGSTENIKLDVGLELNIKINEKSITMLRKNFYDRSLNQENGNEIDTNDNQVIKTIIDYLLKYSGR